MPSVKNETKLAQIKEDLEGAGAVWVVDACGLTVKETQALRQAVREAGASMKVYTWHMYTSFISNSGSAPNGWSRA